MSKNYDGYHSIRINFNSTKRYRYFAFLPRVGDRINLTEDNVMYCMDVDAVWFDDNYGNGPCEAEINCTVKEECPV